MDIQIRAYRQTDKPALLDLFRLNVPESFAAEEENDLLYYLENEIEQYFVAETEGLIVAAGGINFFQAGQEARMSWDMVHPGWQGRGVGTALLQHRLRLVSQLPIIIVRTSQQAYQFYEKNGFRLLSVQKDYWAAGFDLYLMQYENQTT